MRQKNSVISIVIASVCIAVYIVALVWATVRMYVNVEERQPIAEQEFFDIAELAAAAGSSGFMDAAFIRTITNALGASRTLEGLIITGPSGEYAFEKSPGEAIYWVNNSPRFKSRFDFSRQPLYLPLRIQGLRNVNIQAISGAIDYSVLSETLKRTLVLVLASLVLAFFTLLVETLRGGTIRKGQSTNQRYEYEPLPQPITYNAESAAADWTAPVNTVVVEHPAKTAEAVEQPIILGAAPPQAAPPAPAPPPPPAAENNPPDETPRGLYSPRSNVGWEEYAAVRLDSELHSCGASEQDLTLIVTEFKAALDDDTYRRFASDAVRFFTRRELIFEKGKSGITVICPAVDLEKGFAAAGDFRSRIANKYADVASGNGFCMGLSSRSGRIVDAGRLMFEAHEALERALMEPSSPIVAFKSDPEKYRAFVNRKSK